MFVLLQVACMQFINIIVHSVEDVNFRVHLQHEFSLLGLDDYLVVCCPVIILAVIFVAILSACTCGIL